MLGFAVALPQALGDQVANLLQAPGSYIVAMLAKAHHPGFEEQVGYVLLIPLIQWVVYSMLAYVWLARRAYMAQVPQVAASPAARQRS